MHFVLLTYQGPTLLPDSAQWHGFAEDEKKGICSEYESLNKPPGLTPGFPLRLAKDAITVRVQNGETLSTKGPFVDARGAVGGYFMLEADNLDAAIKLAARVPAARLGGAIEVRPVAKYW